jgi:RND family efflux transporter MFP subunit
LATVKRLENKAGNRPFRGSIEGITEFVPPTPLLRLPPAMPVFSRPKRLVLTPARLLAAAACAGIPAARAADQPAVPVVVARVALAEQAAGQSFVGTVMPARISDVGSAVDGRIVELPIVDGQRVKEGQPLAELLRGLLEIEREGAVAELDRRREVLAELRAGSRPEEIEQARAAVAGYEARLAYARGRRDRLVRLAERGTSTVDELQDAQTELQQIEAQLRGSRAALALVEAGPRKEQVAQAAAAVAVQEANVERIDDQLAKHLIRAPFDGWVIERFAEKGQWLARGGLVARIAELDEVEVEVRVPEISVAGLELGVDVRLEFDAAPHHTWIGKVARIVPQADVLSRSFPVQITLANTVTDGEPVLRGGMLARAWLPVGRPASVTVVPKDALVLGGPSPLVFLVDPPAAGGGGGTVRAVPVQLGTAVGGNVEVRTDLQPGWLVVVRGNERLRPGMAVAFEPPSN